MKMMIKEKEEEDDDSENDRVYVWVLHECFLEEETTWEGSKKPMIFLVDKLPNHIIWDIMSRLEMTNDRNAASLTCKLLYQIDKKQRKFLKIGTGLNPANEALVLLCNRFKNLQNIEISYDGWSPALGKMLDDDGILLLSKHCPNLNELSLSHCCSLSDYSLMSTVSFSNLSSLKLSFMPGITATGLMYLFARNKNLRLLHIIQCGNVTSLAFLANHQVLEELWIKNCVGVHEYELFSMGQIWRNLRLLWFEAVRNIRDDESMIGLIEDGYLQQDLICFDSLEQLYLKNCVFNSGREGMACLLERSRKLKFVDLDMCFGVSDFNLHQLSLQSSDLRAFRIKTRSDIIIPYSSLKDIATNCSKLEWVSLSSDSEMPCFSPYKYDGIMSLIEKCPLSYLSLDLTYPFNDVGMKALSSAQFLETLEIMRCQQITDEGMKVLSGLPNLRYLFIVKCLGITDNAFKPLFESYKLDELGVFDCPNISPQGVCGRGIASCVRYRQDLTWML
ncbi:F-box/LRR-repeat protein 14-like [Impatiens glandulifera]|uniref:F-box/LRR-repeat protein 14-like n=1 Tax=Impatiens glandulifera TaxID=253017 RepID=UPI001FB08021|nr:F-box/LRR-repeat protein 14-like [Impatiens glandulifera]